MNNLPLVSVIIPTLNSSGTIGDCMKSIMDQDYPKDRIEIIVADGGSVDGTVEIIKQVCAQNVIILDNRLKTGEAAKAAGAKIATGDILAFIDSDNILPSEVWLKRMVEPFLDLAIIASEPLEYAYRRTDGYITRYCALMGMNDPLCLFTGNYDRYNLISGKWTGIRHEETDRVNYLKVTLKQGRMPTIGANGFLIRKSVFSNYSIGDYLFDIDVLYEVLEKAREINIAKVKIGIVHIFAGGFKDFIRKQNRRIKDYAYYKKLGLRKYEWDKVGMFGIIKFVIYCLLIFPLVLQAARGFFRKNDPAWCFHAPACLSTFYIYTLLSVHSMITVKPFSRNKWQVKA